jgi:hypothetical protein
MEILAMGGYDLDLVVSLRLRVGDSCRKLPW